MILQKVPVGLKRVHLHTNTNNFQYEKQISKSKISKKIQLLHTNCLVRLKFYYGTAGTFFFRVIIVIMKVIRLCRKESLSVLQDFSEKPNRYAQLIWVGTSLTGYAFSKATFTSLSNNELATLSSLQRRYPRYSQHLNPTQAATPLPTLLAQGLVTQLALQ